MDTPEQPKYQVIRRGLGNNALTRAQAVQYLLEGETVEVSAVCVNLVLHSVRVRGYRKIPGGQRVPPEISWASTGREDRSIAGAQMHIAVLQHAVNIAQAALLQDERDRAGQQQATS